MNSLRKNVDIAEWWTRNIASGWERAAGTLTSWLPVSVFELLLMTAILVGISLLVRFFINLHRKRYGKVLLGVLAVAVAALYVLDAYMLSMGFGYYRAAMPLHLSGADYKSENVNAACEYFLDDYNRLATSLERDENGCVICPYEFAELSELIAQEYARLNDDYFFSYTPNAKQVVNSRVLSAFWITGITFLPTGEANLNVAAPPTSVTITLAHELAHTKGVQRETDANLISQYILLSSKNDYLRYCGYYGTFNNLLGAVYIAGDKDSYSAYSDILSEYVRAERKFENAYWETQPDVIGKIGDFFNNVYLKLNGVSSGTGSYGAGGSFTTITPIDPETGKPELNPDTGKPIVVPVYSTLQKMYFYLYETR